MELTITMVSGQDIITFPDKVVINGKKVFVYHRDKIDEYYLAEIANIEFVDNF